MEVSQSVPTPIHRSAHRVKGPRPFSWISSTSDSSLNGEAWPWSVRGSNLSRESIPSSCVPSESSDSSPSSSPSHPVHTLDELVEDDDTSYSPHGHRRKPVGPRDPPNGSCFDMRRLELWIATSQSVIPQLQLEVPPITRIHTPIQTANALQSPQVPPSSLNSPTNFPLDWDAIFEVLGCSEGPPRDAGAW